MNIDFILKKWKYAFKQHGHTPEIRRNRPQEREGRAGSDVAPALAREVDRETVRQLVEGSPAVVEEIVPEQVVVQVLGRDPAEGV